MCDEGAMIQSEDDSGNAVFLCSECGGVFTVIHNCAVHMICAVDDDLYVLGDMNSECEGVVIEGRGVSEMRCLLGDMQAEVVAEVRAEAVVNQSRDAAAWN